RVQDLWRFEQTGRELDGRLRGKFRSTGAKPTFFARFAAAGFPDVDVSFFDGSSEDAPLPPIVEAKPRDTEPEQKPVTKRPAAPPPKKVSTPPPAPSVAKSSIELDPELQAEVEARLPHESTLITRNPLDDEDTQPGTRRRP